MLDFLRNICYNTHERNSIIGGENNADCFF